MSNRNIKRNKIDKIFGLLALVLIITAWIIGYSLNGNQIAPFLKQISPEASVFRLIDTDIYAEYFDSSKTPSSYISVGRSDGYGGKLELLVQVDSSGKIINSLVTNHKETEAFFQKTINSDIQKKLVNKTQRDKFLVNIDIEGISGATYTSKALVSAAGIATRKVTRNILGLETAEEVNPQINIELPILLIIILFIISIYASSGKIKQVKMLRWVIMILSLIMIGFIFTRPISLGIINKFLLGFWPEWQTNLYWYILLAGVVLSIFVTKKNIYCEWICPFGAAQECISKVGGFNKNIPQKVKYPLIWVQRILALVIIILALIYRNPNYFSFEIFGSFFQLIGTTLQFALMGLFLITSIFINRPWCNVLCPVRPITDYFRMFRKTIKN